MRRRASRHSNRVSRNDGRRPLPTRPPRRHPSRHPGATARAPSVGCAPRADVSRAARPARDRCRYGAACAGNVPAASACPRRIASYRRRRDAAEATTTTTTMARMPVQWWSTLSLWRLSRCTADSYRASLPPMLARRARARASLSPSIDTVVVVVAIVHHHHHHHHHEVDKDDERVESLDALDVAVSARPYRTVRHHYRRRRRRPCRRHAKHACTLRGARPRRRLRPAFAARRDAAVADSAADATEARTPTTSRPPTTPTTTTTTMRRRAIWNAHRRLVSLRRTSARASSSMHRATHSHTARHRGRQHGHDCRERVRRHAKERRHGGARGDAVADAACACRPHR